MRWSMKKLRVNDRKVKFWFNFFYEIPDNEEVEIFVEHTDEDQWNYDVVDSEGGPVLHDEEGLIDVDVIEKSDENDSTTEECEEDWVLLEKVEIIKSKEKLLSLEFPQILLAMFSNDTQEDDFATSHEELMSLHGDSDDENHKRSIVFNPTRDLEDPNFKFALNMIFSNSKEFKKVVEVHSVIQKKDIKFKKNESTRSRATCKVSSCKWFIFASKANQSESFMIKTIGPDHSCGNQRDNQTTDSEFLAKKYVEELKINLNWGVKEFQDHVMRTHNCTISRNQAYMAKRKALDLITETKEEQFEMLWDYCAEIRRSNPGITCILKLDENSKTMVNDRKRFLRLFVFCSL
ncbi:uncharacterized protein LOC129875841 [Solanum dulcamara]|uniref:uncharacterized protein LOC129875841 n=1 Tax=Solanum dulcamara TaxID=45834 RepID=UPI00248618DB|nr:uncharacterized protein LOC129875841 [Solanum dulcamara]